MSMKGCTAVIDDLIQVYPEDTVMAHLEWVYREQIGQVITEIDELLPRYRARVDAPTYELERAKVMLVQAWESEGVMSVRGLEVSLKYLLKKQRTFAGVSPLV